MTSPSSRSIVTPKLHGVITMEELIKYLKALIALQARVVAENQPTVKLELLLFRAGLSHKEIADILDKSQAAVSKSISRSKLSS